VAGGVDGVEVLEAVGMVAAEMEMRLRFRCVGCQVACDRYIGLAVQELWGRGRKRKRRR
jgi:hypothetical protein